MNERDAAVESLLGSLRGCHQPVPADRRRVRAALEDALVEGSGSQLQPSELQRRAIRCSGDGDEEASGVHSKPAGHERVPRPWGVVRRYHFGPSHLLVGALALAAAAAVAVVALARPGVFGGSLVARDESRTDGGDSPSSKPELRAESAVLGRSASGALLGSSGVESGLDDTFDFGRPAGAPGCDSWPCLGARPERAFALAGVALEAEASTPPAETPTARSPFEPRDEASPLSEAARGRFEVTPAVVFDVTGGRVSPGVGVRLAAAITKKRELAVQATAQRFETGVDRQDSLWALGSGVCWNPMVGKVDVSLCGTLGYERSRSTGAPRDAWRVTAGADAHAVWNVTHAAGVYLAFQTATPVIGDRPSDRAFSMRVMAGPELRF